MYIVLMSTINNMLVSYKLTSIDIFPGLKNTTEHSFQKIPPWRGQGFKSKNLGWRLRPALSLVPENIYDFTQVLSAYFCIYKFLEWW